MAYVIAEPCVDVMDQACVAVCPVDCIHFEQGTDRMLYYLDGRLDSVRNRAGAAPLGGAWNMNINATPAGGIDVTGLVSWAEGTNALHQLAPARIRRLYLAGMGLLFWAAQRRCH